MLFIFNGVNFAFVQTETKEYIIRDAKFFFRFQKSLIFQSITSIQPNVRIVRVYGPSQKDYRLKWIR